MFKERKISSLTWKGGPLFMVANSHLSGPLLKVNCLCVPWPPLNPAPTSCQKNLYLHTDDINMPTASVGHKRGWPARFKEGSKWCQLTGILLREYPWSTFFNFFATSIILCFETDSAASANHNAKRFPVFPADLLRQTYLAWRIAVIAFCCLLFVLEAGYSSMLLIQ